MKLDLACGQAKEDGWIGVDIIDGPRVDICMDLLCFPWDGWEANSVDELLCKHFIEHIPHRRLLDAHLPDPFFVFFDECCRILKPGGTMRITCPALTSFEAFADPTHQRYITLATFRYLNAKIRKEIKVDHYPVTCDFVLDENNTTVTMPQSTQMLGDKMEDAIFHDWNRVGELSVLLVARK